MPELDSTTTITYSSVFDTLALLNLWQSDQLTSAGFAELNLLLNEQLNSANQPILNVIDKYDLNSIQLCEFLVRGYAADDVTEFCGTLKQLPLHEYLLQLFDGEYSNDTIHRLLDEGSFTEPDEVYTLINPFLLQKDIELLHMPFLNLIESVGRIFEPFAKKYQPGLSPYRKYLHNQLTLFPPLEVAQNELAKRFIRISEYQTFRFFISPFATRAIRFFDETTLLTFTGPNITKPIRNEADAVNLLKILADDTRLSILKMLTHEKLYGKQIAERLGKTTATVSHHLDTLHKAGLIRQEKQKQTKFYSFHPKALDDRFSDIVQLISK